MAETLLDRTRGAAAKRVLFLPHAVRQMARPDRMVTVDEVRAVAEKGEVIEEYPDDPRGESVLLLGFGEGAQPVHVVAAPKDEYLAIITAYLPDPEAWEPGFRARRRP